jgi:hypothetical protein
MAGDELPKAFGWQTFEQFCWRTLGIDQATVHEYHPI